MYPTILFFAHLFRDLAGTFLARWRRFYRRAVFGEEAAAIAIDIFPFFEKMTGVGWYEWNLLAAMDRLDSGLEFNLYAHTFLAPDEPAPPAMPGSRHMRARVHQIPARFWLPVRPTLALLRTFAEPLLRWLDGNDAVFAPNFFPHRTQAPWGQSLVITVHDLAFAVMPETVAPETLAELARRLPRALFASERIIAVSEATRQDLIAHLGVSPRRIHVIHEGLDPRFAAGAAGGEPPAGLPERYMLVVSTIEPRKNVAAVVRAFNLLADWGYRGGLVLVGRWGWHTGGIRAEIDASPVRDRIVHLDYVERDALPALYRGADALLFPSLMEGFGLPILEAMACGTPVVTSGQSAMPEVAGPAGIYVDPTRPQSIASAVEALLSDEQHRARLAELGRARASRFDWERAAAATTQVLRQAVGWAPGGDDEYRV
ncbi:MAG: glycosyltransferase family 4 protein [Acidobacteria bacterium]|nr:glycosyltransferase family 4 protein [Acidobacteriota bacterium]